MVIIITLELPCLWIRHQNLETKFRSSPVNFSDYIIMYHFPFSSDIIYNNKYDGLAAAAISNPRNRI